MLYDPKWEKTTKAKPFSKKHVMAWLKSKPSDESYCYTDNGRCLIAQYLSYLGHTGIYVGSGGNYYTRQIRSGQAPDWLWWASIAGGIHTHWTFGGALKRIRADRAP